MGSIEKETHLEEQWGKTSVIVVSWGTPRTSQTERRILPGLSASSNESPGPLDRSLLGGGGGMTAPKFTAQQSRMVLDHSYDDIKVDWQEKRDLFKFICGEGETADPDIFLDLLKSTGSHMFGQGSSAQATTRVDVEDFFRLLNPSGVVDWEVFDVNCETNKHMKRLVGKLTAQRRKRVLEMKNKGNRVLDLPPIEMEQQDLYWSWDSRAIRGRKNSIAVDIRTDSRPAVELVDLTPKEPKKEDPKPVVVVEVESTPPSQPAAPEPKKKSKCCVIL